MTDLRTAAQQALGAMLNFPDDISDEMFESITALKAALAEPDWQDLYLKEKKRADMWRDKYESIAGAEQRIHPLAEPVQQEMGCDHCNQPLYAAIKCRVCGRETPIIEPGIKGDNKPNVADDLAFIVRNSIAYIKELELERQMALNALVMMRDTYGEANCPACDHADAAIKALRGKE